MQSDNRVGLDYAAGNITSLFGKIFFPTLMGMIFTALITIVDGVFVGRGVGPDGIAAVNIIAPLYMVCTGLGLMLGIGASVVGGMALASRDERRASVVITQSFVVATVISALVVIVALLIPLPLGKKGNAHNRGCVRTVRMQGGHG